MTNIGVFINDVNNCINGFKNKDFHLAGKSVGDILFRLFLTNSLEEEDMSVGEIIAVISGFLDGLNQGGNFNNLEECIDEIPDIIADVKNVIVLMKNLDWKNLEKIVDALMSIVDTIRRILANIKPCSKIPEDIETLIKKFKAITLGKLIDKLLHNTMQIINGVSAAIKKLGNKDFLSFGRIVGTIMFILVVQ